MARPFPWSQAALSLAVVGVTVWRVSFTDLRAAFHDLDRGSLYLAFFCILALMVLRAYKWHRLVAAVSNFRIQQSLRTLLGGCALGMITPGRIGELGRCIFVRKHERTQVGILTLLDRALDFWALVTLVGASLFLLVPEPAAVFGLALWLALIPVVLGLPGLLAHLSKMVQRLRHFHEPLAEVAAGLPAIPMVRYALMALAAMWLELSSFFFLLRALSPTGFATAVSTYPYIALAGDLPLSFGGVGVREGAAAVLLSPYAIPPGAAVDAALLWFVLGIFFPAVLGVAWLAVERLRSSVPRSNSGAAEPDGFAPLVDSAPHLVPVQTDSAPLP